MFNLRPLRFSVLMVLAVLAGMVVRSAVAQDRLRVVDAAFITEHENASVYLDYLSEKTARLDIDDMVADQRDARLGWHQNTAKVPGFGFDTHTHWFRLVITNGGQRALDRLLEIKNPVLDEVVLYQINEEGELVDQVKTGDGLPTTDRPFFHHNLILPIRIPPAETHHVYFRVTTSGAMEFPLELWSPRAFQERDQLQLLLYGALFGILVVMGLYNFFIYTLFRDLSLLYYAGYVVGLMLFLASLYGFANQYLWTDNAWWRERSLVLIIPVTLFFAMMFTASFLQLRAVGPVLSGLVHTGAAVCGVLFVLAFFLDYALLIRVSAALVFPVSLIAILLGVYRWLKGYQPARYFILAWTVFLLAIAYFSLAKFGVFQLSQASESAVQWGAVMEMVLFAFALADRLNSQRRAFIKAQGKALELQRIVNEELEDRVEERTQELRTAMDELGAANQRLQALSMQDGLTGIYNRRYFDTKIDREWQRGLRSKESLALLLIDIDFFKNFNDRYGHLAGDECLKRVAQVINGMITRPSDAVARYGGEEFVVVLPDTTNDGAVHVAEKIRRAMQDIAIKVDSDMVRVSVSIGVAATVPAENSSSQGLLASADQALYQAKLAGRNRTQLAGVAVQL